MVNAGKPFRCKLNFNFDSFFFYSFVGICNNNYTEESNVLCFIHLVCCVRIKDVERRWVKYQVHKIPGTQQPKTKDGVKISFCYMDYLQIILYITKVNWCIVEVTCLQPCLFTSGYEMSPDEGQEEYEEVQADLKKREEEVSICFQRNQLTS